MWNPRSAAHHVVPAFICLISLLIAVGAHAQTATTDASDSKRVQVLQIQEASATNENSIKKSKSAATPAKKKVVKRKTHGQTKATANEDAPTPEHAGSIRDGCGRAWDACTERHYNAFY